MLYHNSGDAGPSSSSFHYRYYRTEADSSGTANARPSFALRAPAADRVDRGDDDNDDDDDDEDDDTPRQKRDRRPTYE